MAAGRIHEPFAVINSDDFYGRAAFHTLTDFYRDWTPEWKNDYCMVGYELGKTLSEHGSVSRGICRTDENSFLVEVTERTKIEGTAKGIMYLDDTGQPVFLDALTTVSMNFWGFTPSFFKHLESDFFEFLNVNAGDPRSEYYIPGVVSKMIRHGEASVKVLRCNDQWFGMTYREDRELVSSKILELVGAGVYPEVLWK
jgi:hypothetical protein